MTTHGRPGIVARKGWLAIVAIVAIVPLVSACNDHPLAAEISQECRSLRMEVDRTRRTYLEWSTTQVAPVATVSSYGVSKGERLFSASHFHVRARFCLRVREASSEQHAGFEARVMDAAMEFSQTSDPTEMHRTLNDLVGVLDEVNALPLLD